MLPGQAGAGRRALLLWPGSGGGKPPKRATGMAGRGPCGVLLLFWGDNFVFPEWAPLGVRRTGSPSPPSARSPAAPTPDASRERACVSRQSLPQSRASPGAHFLSSKQISSVVPSSLDLPGPGALLCCSGHWAGGREPQPPGMGRAWDREAGPGTCSPGHSRIGTGSRLFQAMGLAFCPLGSRVPGGISQGG